MGGPAAIFFKKKGGGGGGGPNTYSGHLGRGGGGGGRGTPGLPPPGYVPATNKNCMTKLAAL